MFYPLPHKGVAVAALLLLSACSAVTSVSSVQPDTSITIKNGTGTSNPRTEKLSATSFGNYEFKGRCCSNQGTIPQFGDLIS